LRYDVPEPDPTIDVIARGAPGAELVFIDLAEPARLGDIREGIDLIARLAADRPWVAHLNIRRDATSALDLMLAELGRGVGRSIVCRSPLLATTIARIYEAARRPLSGDEIRRALRRAPDPVKAVADAPTLVEGADLGEGLTDVIAVHRLVSSSGMRLTPVNAAQTWVGGQPLAPQFARLILNSIVAGPVVTEDLITAATPLVAAASWSGVDLRRKATDKQKIRSITVRPTLAFALQAWLELGHGIKTTLTQDEIGRVERAVAVSLLWNRDGKHLSELYPWMSEHTLTAFAWRRRAFLDDLHCEALAATPKPHGKRSTAGSRAELLDRSWQRR
jgi:hypothetical protein